MKQSIKLIFLAGILVILMLLAVWGYKYLSGRYEAPSKQDDKVSEADTTEQKTEDTAEEAEPLEKATDFTVKDYDDNDVSLSDYFGKPIIVNFWATWCGPCQSELPAFNNAYKKYGGDIEFMMVDLTDGSYETVSGVKEYVEENGFDFPVYFDTGSEASLAYKINAIPLTLMIDKDGSIHDTHLGAMNEKQLESYINELLGG